ncbi:hypothetical protein UA75_00295 [Actinoalloteichus sp. GBA129-24]|uniref:Uncharacterized protein n=1 Tax=Actinoalloteichus fjordicus TaxID=1612552 RepID=A0AAC9L882_9PSEU|nr:hypothetical protein UA74_00295 [Actinoalloteichus fjordicus]APU18111.1 hypothetical protein UA75_00295 [Actinoalloteichus sp. GBA129-24]
MVWMRAPTSAEPIGSGGLTVRLLRQQAARRPPTPASQAVRADRNAPRRSSQPADAVRSPDSPSTPR